MKYAIRKTVLDFFGENEAIRKMIDEYYKSRSGFVHEGIHLGDRSYCGTSLPQFSATGEIVRQISFTNLILLRELGGRTFRSLINNYIKTQQDV